MLSFIIVNIITDCSLCVFAEEFKGPLEDVLKEKLNLSGEQFLKKCQAKGELIVNQLMKSRDTSKKIANALANDIFYRVTISSDANEHTWNRIVINRCGTNEAVRILSHLSIDNINLCLDKNEQLVGDKKKDSGQAIFKGYCAAIKKL